MNQRAPQQRVHPVQEFDADGSPATLTLGMTLHQHYAAMAMQGLIIRDGVESNEEAFNRIARKASAIADAMTHWVGP